MQTFAELRGVENDLCQCDCVEELGVEDVKMARDELYIKALDAKTRSLWHRVSRQFSLMKLS